METIKKNTIFTNVLLTKDKMSGGRIWMEIPLRRHQQGRKHGSRHGGRKWNKVFGAHPNSVLQPR
jgi:GTP-dependent phosphoenolpyruvate carboxykinase